MQDSFFPRNSFFGRFLVKVSASFSCLEIHLVKMMFHSFNSREKWSRTSMCRVQPPMLQLLAKSTAPLLSTCEIIGFSTFNPNDSILRITYNMSCAQLVAARNSGFGYG